MVTCSHCYELVSKANRRANETCPFCFHILPEPEATPLPEPVAVAADYVYVDPTIAAMQSAQAAAAAAPVKKPHHTVAIVVVILLVLGAGGYFLFGRGGGGGGGADPKQGGLSPKLVPSLKNLNKQALAKAENFFQKTCKPYHDVDYNFLTQLVLKGDDWKALLEPGSGAPGAADWYLCPLKIIDMRAKADMKIKVETRFLSGGLFGSARNFGKVAIEGESVKAMSDFTLPAQETQIESWSEVKNVFYIRMGFLTKAPEGLRALNGAYKEFSLRSGDTYIKMHGTKLVQTEAQGGNKMYGKFEAVIPAWFGDTMSKELRDWGTGCGNDVTEQFRKVAQEQIDRHEDLEEFKDSPQLKEYLDSAEKASRALCAAMPKVWQIMELYDQGKVGEVTALQTELKAALEAAKKAFTTDLEAQIDAIAAKK